MTGKGIVLAALWALSLMIVAALAHAQTPGQRGNIPSGTIVSDLGFRVGRQQGNRVTGTFVVRINGEWLEAEPVGGVKPLTFK
jgi:hypothetical protein